MDCDGTCIPDEYGCCTCEATPAQMALLMREIAANDPYRAGFRA